MIQLFYYVDRIPSYLSHEWILKKHYAKRLPSISYAYGLHRKIDNVLVGICTYGKPASNALCEGVCGKEKKELVYELNRLCVNDDLPKNTLSFFVSQTLKLLPKPLILVSYADKAQGHNGYIYQATNWIYTGATKERTDISTGDGKHSRHYTKGVDYSKNRKDRSSKHRYIMFIGSKKEKRLLKNKLNYKEIQYPKGENKKYDATYAPNLQTRLF